MSYFNDQIETQSEGGDEWYALQNNLKVEKMDGGIPGGFDPFVYWSENID